MAPRTRLTGGERSFEVKTATRLPDVGGQARWLVFFSGMDTREAAEAVRGIVLQAEPLDLVDEDTLWIHELVGAELFDTSGEVVGTVAEVEANPASDLLVLEDGRVIPLTFVTRSGDGTLVVDGPPGLLDL